jgi:hypothetical protein
MDSTMIEDEGRGTSLRTENVLSVHALTNQSQSRTSSKLFQMLVEINEESQNGLSPENLKEIQISLEQAAKYSEYGVR